MLRPFAIEEPSTVAEASALLARHGDDARLYAGGTELLFAMKEGLIRCKRLVNLKTISGLDRLELAEDGSLAIGATATHRRVEHSLAVREHFPALVELERGVANIRVRNEGTLGGNLCFAEPHADPGILLLALGAETRVASGAGERVLPLDLFFLGALEVVLEPDEVLMEVRLPPLPPRSGVAYQSFRYLERPTAGVAALAALADGSQEVAEVRLAVGCVGPRPVRRPAAEGLLRGLSVGDALARAGEAADAAAQDMESQDDLHGSVEYKLHLVQVLAERALRQALERTRGGAARNGGG